MFNQVITRFAPSPTGMLHIGGARTALFNYLFAKANDGKFLLRVEDTDQARSTEIAKDAIIEGLKWLGLEFDQKIVFQSQQILRHQEIVQELLEQGKAYKCYATKVELQELRDDAEKENKRFKYDRRWRDKSSKDAPNDIVPVVRIKAPIDGFTIFNDAVQGEIKIPNDDLDDYIIQRSDGTPTYMLAVVVDDHDMQISHVIRGDDHLTNVAKQIVIYDALGWEIPTFAHIPLIYGEDGKKLSKRHGATSVTEFKDMSYLPEAMRNYLLRLGFSHGDDEIISDDQAIKWFSLDNVGKSPARFDYKKLDSLNNYYFQNLSNDFLLEELTKLHGKSFSNTELIHLKALMSELKVRANDYNSLYDSCAFILVKDTPIKLSTDKAKKIISDNKDLIEPIIEFIKSVDKFDHENLYNMSKVFAEQNSYKMKNVAGILRVAITGSHISPSVFEIMEVFGKDITISRLNGFIE